MKTALLFITSYNLHTMYSNNINKLCKDHKYFIYLSDLDDNYILLQNKLKGYKKIIVLIRLHGGYSDKKRKYYLSKVLASSLLLNILRLNDQCKFEIITTSCWGFYIHEFASLLPKGSILINLSSYVNQTQDGSLLYSYFLFKRTFDIFDIVLFYFQNVNSTLLPCIFVSYYYKQRFIIVCLVTYTNIIRDIILQQIVLDLNTIEFTLTSKTDYFYNIYKNQLLFKAFYTKQRYNETHNDDIIQLLRYIIFYNNKTKKILNLHYIFKIILLKLYLKQIQKYISYLIKHLIVKICQHKEK